MSRLDGLSCGRVPNRDFGGRGRRGAVALGPRALYDVPARQIEKR